MRTVGYLLGTSLTLLLLQTPAFTQTNASASLQKESIEKESWADWKHFDPLKFSEPAKLVPNPKLMQGTNYVYAAGVVFPSDPTKASVVYGRGKSKLPTEIYAPAYSPVMVSDQVFFAPRAGLTKTVKLGQESITLGGTTWYTPLADTSFAANTAQISPFEPSLVYYWEPTGWPSVIYGKPGDPISVMGKDGKFPRPEQQAVIEINGNDKKIHQVRLVGLPEGAIRPNVKKADQAQSLAASQLRQQKAEKEQQARQDSAAQRKEEQRLARQTESTEKPVPASPVVKSPVPDKAPEDPVIAKLRTQYPQLDTQQAQVLLNQLQALYPRLDATNLLKIAALLPIERIQESYKALEARTQQMQTVQSAIQDSDELSALLRAINSDSGKEFDSLLMDFAAQLQQKIATMDLSSAEGKREFAVYLRQSGYQDFGNRGLSADQLRRFLTGSLAVIEPINGISSSAWSEKVGLAGGLIEQQYHTQQISLAINKLRSPTAAQEALIAALNSGAPPDTDLWFQLMSSAALIDPSRSTELVRFLTEVGQNHPDIEQLAARASQKIIDQPVIAESLTKPNAVESFKKLILSAIDLGNTQYREDLVSNMRKAVERDPSNLDNALQFLDQLAQSKSSLAQTAAGVARSIRSDVTKQTEARLAAEQAAAEARAQAERESLTRQQNLGGQTNPTVPEPTQVRKVEVSPGVFKAESWLRSFKQDQHGMYVDPLTGDHYQYTGSSYGGVPTVRLVPPSELNQKNEPIVVLPNQPDSGSSTPKQSLSDPVGWFRNQNIFTAVEAAEGKVIAGPNSAQILKTDRSTLSATSSYEPQFLDHATEEVFKMYQRALGESFRTPKYNEYGGSGDSFNFFSAITIPPQQQMIDAWFKSRGTQQPLPEKMLTAAQLQTLYRVSNKEQQALLKQYTSTKLSIWLFGDDWTLAVDKTVPTSGFSTASGLSIYGGGTFLWGVAGHVAVRQGTGYGTTAFSVAGKQHFGDILQFGTANKGEFYNARKGPEIENRVLPKQITALWTDNSGTYELEGTDSPGVSKYTDSKGGEHFVNYWDNEELTLRDGKWVPYLQNPVEMQVSSQSTVMQKMSSAEDAWGCGVDTQFQREMSRAPQLHIQDRNGIVHVSVPQSGGPPTFRVEIGGVDRPDLVKAFEEPFVRALAQNPLPPEDKRNNPYECYHFNRQFFMRNGYICLPGGVKSKPFLVPEQETASGTLTSTTAAGQIIKK